MFASQLVALALFLLQQPSTAQPGPAPRQGVARTGSAAQVGPCIPPGERQRIRRLLDIRPASLRAPSGSLLASEPLLENRSLGGNLHQDVMPGSFVDLDAGPGWSDYACGNFSRDTHGGHDIGLRSFDEQAIGVPVFAVRDGVVAAVQDGMPDMNTSGGSGGNFVIVDHGGGEEGWYFHLKNGSVAVSPGQNVVAGQQLGKAASSGNSYGPHLHLEIQRGGVPVEPSAGFCESAPSDWARQAPLRTDNLVLDFGFTSTDLWTVPGLPFRWPADNQFAFTDGSIWVWVQGANMPANSNWKMRFLRPDGTLSDETPTFDFNNPEFFRDYGVWFPWWVTEMHSIAGTWTIEVHFNGQLMVAAPCEVVATIDPLFNRPPEAVSVGFDPDPPSPHRALYARVGGSLVLDDLDYDLVRYRWLWKVNGGVVRDVVTAGRADALQKGAFSVGDLVECEVTPNDGSVDGAVATSSATVPADPWVHHGLALHGTPGVPHLGAWGTLVAGAPGVISLSQARANSFSLLMVGTAVNPVPLRGGFLVPNPLSELRGFLTDPSGNLTLPFAMPAGIPAGTPLVMQFWIVDPVAPWGASASNGVSALTP